MTKENQLQKIKQLSWVTILVDIIAIVGFIFLLILFFSSVAIPGKSAEMEYPESTLPAVTTVFGKVYAMSTVNLLITIFIIFLVIAISLLTVNIKHILTRDLYDYHRWESGNMFIKAFLSLLTLNVVSFSLRLYTANEVMDYAENKSLIEFTKEALEKRKEKKEINKNKDKNNELSHEEKELKRRVQTQMLTKFLRYFFTYLALVLFAVFILIPFYWMILTALKTHKQANASVPEVFMSFKNFQWVNIKFVIKELKFGLYIRNTLVVAVVSTLGTIITTILAAFAFARIDFKGREAIFSLLLMTMMIPGEIYMITNYLTVSKYGFGWIGTGSGSGWGYFATMILPFMTSIFYIFFLRQTFKQVPDALYRAAKVDGCSDFKFLRRVMLPIAGPTIFTITILSILGSWNAFIWPRLITSVEPNIGKEFWLVSVALRESSFVLDKGGGVAETMFNLQIAATAIVTVPLVIVFLALKKYIIRGVGTSGTKG